MSRALRLLLTPRWLAVTLFVIIAFVTCLALGAWQFDRAHQKPRPVALEDERVVPLADVVEQPADVDFPSGLLVRGTGRYADETFTVRGTDGSGTPGAWAATSIVLDGTGRTLAVVRGAARPAPSAPTTAEVVVTGRLQPPEATGGLTATELTARGLDPRGYLVLTDQRPADARPATVVSSPVPLRSPGLRWQNSVYAVQWWLFGGFAVFAWIRFFRDDLRDQRSEEAAGEG